MPSRRGGKPTFSRKWLLRSGLVTLFAFLLTVSLAGLVSADPLVINSCAWADSVFGSSVPSNACDQIQSTVWESSNSAYPHWIVFNLTASNTVTDFVVVWPTFGETPQTFDFQLFVNNVWTSQQRFAGPSACSATKIILTYTLTTPVTTNQFRLFGNVGLCNNFMAMADISVIGHVPVINISTSDLIALSMLLFVFILTLGLAVDIHPLFFVICGISGILLALETFTLTQNVPLTILTAGSALLLLVFGAIEIVGAIQHEATRG